MLWILYIAIDAIVNWWLIEKRHARPNYLVLFIVRGMAAILYGAFVLNVSPATMWMWLIFVTFSFPFPFNLLLNLLRHKALNYYGANSGIIDRVIVKYRLQDLYFVMTLIMFIAAALVWIKLLQPQP